MVFFSGTKTAVTAAAGGPTARLACVDESRTPRTASQLFKTAGAAFATVISADFHSLPYIPDTLRH